MACTNCFSGCVETISDKCVKYTGNPIEFLNIHTGDPLEVVEKSITDYLLSVFSGIGIFPTIDSQYICDVVKQYFPCAECGAPTLVDILTAIIRAICDLSNAIDANRQSINIIEANYDVGCINVAPSIGTHAILEAVIRDLCTAIGDIETINNLLLTYVKISDIGTYIQNYIDTNITTNLMNTKMVPYAIYPFYPSPLIMTGAFGSTGEGIGIWAKVYLCNGNNGTPDLRGRSLIGTTSGMLGGAFDSTVDPSLGNPVYDLDTTYGQNSVILSSPQMAAHSHVATVTIDDPGHQTSIAFTESGSGLEEGGARYPIESINSIGSDHDGVAASGKTSNVLDKTGLIGTGLTGTNVTVSNAVNTPTGQAHNNVHPVHACYYIMYIPT